MARARPARAKKTKKPKVPRAPLPRPRGGPHEDRTKRPHRRRKYRRPPRDDD